MNELRIFENPEFGEVRTIIVGDEVWFVGNDVAKALGYQRPDQAVRTNVDEMDSTLMGVIDSMGREQKTKVINESGLYSLIIGSRIPSAKRFKRWVTSEILPSIRKHGGYILNQDTMSDDEIMERAMLVAQSRIAERDRIIASQKEEIQKKDERIAVMEPDASAFQALCDSKLLTNFRDGAKELGMSQSQFIGWLKREKYIYSTSKGELRPMEAYRKSDLFRMKSYTNPNNGFAGIQTYLTPKGLQYFKMQFEARGIMPDALPKHGGRNGRKKR